ncbi:LOG family protein [Aspergillus undulatus]|uniref:LOG family protein n=1 Tax=Aspergillus undulatus TaxID=1810928 RepID=UPI003CCDC04D
MEAARGLARIFAENNIQLVYGGGTKGLMGEIARTLVSLSGPQSVHGIIPRALVSISNDNDKPKDSLSATGSGKVAERVVSGTTSPNGIPDTEYGVTTVVADMHSRKRMMAEKVKEGGPGSGFVALAGGFGTIEEVMEMTTWNQLGIHHVGIVLLNIAGYWDGLLEWVRNSVREGYVSKENGGILVEAKSVEEVWPALVKYQVSEGRYKLKWEEE